MTRRSKSVQRQQLVMWLAGVFMMVAFGIVAGIFIISIEIAYKRHRRLKEKELELAKTAADRWRGNIEVLACLCTGQSLVVLQRQQLHPFNGPLSGTTRVSRYRKGKTNQDYTGARDSEWQWHQLGHMQICTSLQTDNHSNTRPLIFYRPDALPAAHPTVSKH